jgi:hypothetical protein
MKTLPYRERAHEHALDIHSRRWDTMRETGSVYGRDSDEYRQARQDMLDAKSIVKLEARRPGGPNYRR